MELGGLLSQYAPWVRLNSLRNFDGYASILLRKVLSDFNKEASVAYDCLHESFAFGMKGVSKRSAFVIDKTGIIRYIEVLENPMDVPNFDAIKEALNKL